MITTKNVIFTYVFDTILYRKPISERRRQYMAATLLVDGGLLPKNDRKAVTAVYWARRKAQKFSFRTRAVAGDIGDVRSVDIFKKQAKLLNLGEDALERMLAAELEVEKQCLFPNYKLIEKYKRASENGKKIIGVSDTTLDTSSLKKLLTHFFPIDWLDELYSSADVQMTKRRGDLFGEVLKRHDLSPNDVCHIGDNKISDGKRAAANGLSIKLLPRSKYHTIRTKLNGINFEIGRWKKQPKPNLSIKSQEEFGFKVLGPIFTSFSLQLWLYLAYAQERENVSALFCARGGLIMRAIHDAVLEKMQISYDYSCQNFMVSRFILAKAGLCTGDETVLREISREYNNKSLDEVISSFSDKKVAVSKKWQKPYTIESMKDYLSSDDAHEFLSVLGRQHDLFITHFNKVMNGSKRGILIDTGLYGSIQLFQQNLTPNVLIESVLLARSNYKKFSEDHFKNVSGLLVENEGYDPINPATSLLRYWQLIEEVFEPKLQSVKSFESKNSKAVSNLEEDNWEDQILNHDHPIYLGVMRYIESLGADSLVSIIEGEESAWKIYKKVIIFPSKREADFMRVGLRTRDFGLQGYANEETAKSTIRLQRFKQSLWKNGAVYQEYPAIAKPLQGLMEIIYLVRRLKKIPMKLKKLKP